ncbi:RagB/SusD family nutrient uptake outer membrane protein [Flavobacterium sp. ENC]|uniref:RagB/SusD family nutrient uptake outer membrane protein n=1 Tax=Flavobacterium sp. ENC TaxID=2897330 RepID=UPI001E4808E2|nr:RagB/SusD family nutrient uptake outer membrane protein [Flavobacterium sp. ENC]MCD0466073.1 RagB/SusD family nutrient uptake outer membrane protein [Flavobacterium sp. ENC]
MKKYIKITSFLFLFAAALSSCSTDFLDVVPQGSQLAVSTNDYNLLMNYRNFYYYEAGSAMQAPIWMGDEISANESDLNSNNILAQRLFKWEDVIYQPSDDSFSTNRDLTLGLSNIYVCNKIINEVMTSTEGTDAQKRALRAEAMATRAFENFLMTNLYTKPYAAATASTDLGFPVITSAEVTATSFERGTVQQTYDFIINDLTQAIADLPLKNTIRTRMSKPAAEGLLGKVYLFMGKYTEALPYLNAAFADLQSSSDGPRLYDYNVEFSDGGSFLPIDSYAGPNSPGNNKNDLTESVLSKVCYNTYAGNGPGINGSTLSAETAALYLSSDLRLNLYSPTYQYGDANPYGRLRKYAAQYTRFGLELSELYLLRAECKARLNDLSGAIDDVEMLRNNRMPVADAAVPSNIAGNQTALIKFILEERIREFANEGYRWFDMRRLSVDANTELAATVKKTHTAFDNSNVPTTYNLRPERLTLQFPQRYMNANPGMQNNQ